MGLSFENHRLFIMNTYAVVGVIVLAVAALLRGVVEASVWIGR